MMFGVASMTAPLKRVAIRPPGTSLLNADAAAWHYGPKFTPQRVEDNHARFVDLMIRSDVDVVAMDQDDLGIADAVFTYDASLMTPKGAILMAPGKPLRQSEPDIHRAFYKAQNIPVIAELSGTAKAEAGDTLWLEDNLLAIGRGFRTNDAGARQISTAVSELDIQSFVVDLPCYRGETACLHLMSLISLVDTKLALVCVELLPVPLWQKLKDLDFKLIEAPFDEFEQSGTLSTNVLAISPGCCIMLDGFPKTRDALERAGVNIQVFDGDALCIGCEGGPTCLTRPLFRSQ